MTAKILIIIGIILIAFGIFWPWIQKLGLGHLPGDIIIKREHFKFYFPIVTSLIVSLIITIIIWFFRK